METIPGEFPGGTIAEVDSKQVQEAARLKELLTKNKFWCPDQNEMEPSDESEGSSTTQKCLQQNPGSLKLESLQGVQQRNMTCSAQRKGSGTALQGHSENEDAPHGQNPPEFKLYGQNPGQSEPFGCQSPEQPGATKSEKGKHISGNIP